VLSQIKPQAPVSPHSHGTWHKLSELRAG
jgi:hypothetical protein